MALPSEWKGCNPKVRVWPVDASIVPFDIQVKAWASCHAVHWSLLGFTDHIVGKIDKYGRFLKRDCEKFVQLHEELFPGQAYQVSGKSWRQTNAESDVPSNLHSEWSMDSKALLLWFIALTHIRHKSVEQERAFNVLHSFLRCYVPNEALGATRTLAPEALAVGCLKSVSPDGPCLCLQTCVGSLDESVSHTSLAQVLKDAFRLQPECEAVRLQLGVWILDLATAVDAHFDATAHVVDVADMRRHLVSKYHRPDPELRSAVFAAVQEGRSHNAATLLKAL
eukprot:6471225-Amphidinium_carterae.1